MTKKPKKRNVLKWIWNYFSGISRHRFAYWLFLFFGITIFVISIFRFPVMDSKELKKGKKVRITSLPYFDDDNREIRLKLDGFSNEMVISGIDYRCVNEKLFRMELRKDSIINIQYQNNRIYSIAKNGVQYLNLKKANIEKRKSNRLGIALGVVFMIMTSIGIFNKEEPSISFGILLVVACFLTALFFR